jgi:predicted membrane protein
MNESTLTQLKVIVERAVRPVRASAGRKQKMREELLAHVIGVFEEEAAKLGDEQAAVERTALRFGNPAEVTSQLQEAVPARDAVRRYWEGRPGEPVWRTALRFAWVSGTLALLFAVFLLAVASFTVGSVGAWPREALILSLCAVLTIPTWMSGLVFLTSFMEKALYGPAGRSWLKVALAVAGAWLFILLWFAAWSWPIRSAERGNLNANVLVLAGLVLVPLHACALAQSSLLRKRNQEERNQEEWGRLSIDVPS